MQPLTDEQFDAIIEDALDDVPGELMAMLDNVVFLVEAEPPGDDPDLLGIYEGTPLTERGSWWDGGSLPDRITLFRGPLTRMCEDRRGAARRDRRDRGARDRPPLRHRGAHRCTSSVGAEPNPLPTRRRATRFLPVARSYRGALQRVLALPVLEGPADERRRSRRTPR